MTDIIDLNAKRAPVVYTVTIAHHYDGTLEFNIENVSDDERSREAILHAFRRISGADEEIEKLTADLKQAIYSDSEYCEVVSAENSDLRARIAELEAALTDCADALESWVDDLYARGSVPAGYGAKYEKDVAVVNAARAALKGENDG